MSAFSGREGGLSDPGVNCTFRARASGVGGCQASAVLTHSRPTLHTRSSRDTELCFPGCIYLCLTLAPPLLHIKITRLPSMMPENRTRKLKMTLKSSVGPRGQGPALLSHCVLWPASGGRPHPRPGSGKTGPCSLWHPAAHAPHAASIPLPPNQRAAR